MTTTIERLRWLRADPGTWTGTPEPASESAREQTYEPLAVIGVAPAALQAGGYMSPEGNIQLLKEA